ncbi:MAG: coenzyme F420-0:L-glutamate ligase [Thaumarchaeota archaeon]|nr:coenzyme F420-0:L-glutamate ligase [Nitrososphaerota archaeon]
MNGYFQLSDTTYSLEHNHKLPDVSALVESIQVFPVRSEIRTDRFDLPNAVWRALKNSRITLQNEDIIAISSKFASIAEGRVVELAKVFPKARAIELSKKYQIESNLAQLVIDESDSILGGVNGFLLSLVKGTIAPNAGIDRSNVKNGWAILYPKNPDLTTKRVRKVLLARRNDDENSDKIAKLGVILTDSRVTPTRLGTVGIALAVSGMKSTIDLRGERDLYGNKLKVTLRAIADQVATVAQLMMGEAGEAIPIALIRGLHFPFAKPKNKFENMSTISPDKCLIIGGLRNGIASDLKD